MEISHLVNLRTRSKIAKVMKMIDSNQMASGMDATTTHPLSNFESQMSYKTSNLASNIYSSEYEVEAGGNWDLSGAFISRLNEDLEFEETVISSIRRIERYLSTRGYINQEFRGEVEYYNEEDIYPDYRLRVGIDISDASEWLEIEDEVQDIVVESEVGDTELYVVVDRQRA